MVHKPSEIYIDTGYPLHRENRENSQKYSLSGKTQGIWKFCKNTGNLVCSSREFPDSKGNRNFGVCLENLQFFWEAGESLASQFCVCISEKCVRKYRPKFSQNHMVRN